MKKKIIVGFIGEKGVGKTTASKVLISEGFYRVSLMSKIEEFANYLFSDEEIALNKEKILNQVKQRGMATYKKYWLNLVLMAIPENKDYIVIDDLEEGDVQDCPIVKVIEIYKTKQEGNNKDGIIINDGTLKEFKEKIKTLVKTLSKNESRKK
ncbi:hypothetical protein D4R86_02145 [bacterium]|nr:MAG: hypothetical protein D4R86_02145 [bacterium]